jgi:hypothetical protein
MTRKKTTTLMVGLVSALIIGMLAGSALPSAHAAIMKRATPPGNPNFNPGANINPASGCFNPGPHRAMDATAAPPPACRERF